MSKEEKKYYHAYAEGWKGDITEEDHFHCIEDRIPMPHWRELEGEELKEVQENPNIKFIER